MEKEKTAVFSEKERVSEPPSETVDFGGVGRNRDRDRERDRECDGCGSKVTTEPTFDEFII